MESSTPLPVTARPDGLILVFASNTETLNGEDLLETAGVDFEIIPVPKALNPNCGLALRLTDSPSAWAALGGLTPIAVYRRLGDAYVPLEPPPAAPEKFSPPKPGGLSRSFAPEAMNSPGQ